MNIIIDYDETYTADPIFWDGFITLLRERLHSVVCCTMRMPNEGSFNSDVIEDMGKHDIEIVYAAPYHDKWEAVQAAGYIPENAIWIDDRPMFIFMNRSQDEYESL